MLTLNASPKESHLPLLHASSSMSASTSLHRRKQAFHRPDGPCSMIGTVLLLLVMIALCAVVAVLHLDTFFCSGDASEQIVLQDQVQHVLPDDDDSEVRLPIQESPDSISKREELRQRFIRISGYEALHDPSSFQYITWEWLADTDTGVHSDRTIDERYIIALLYFSTDGDQWSHNSCNVLTQPTICDRSCPYSGVLCDEDDHVVQIDWKGSQLLQMRGFLMSEIGYLTHLTSLNLYKNALHGSLPSELGQLTKLTSLILMDNHFGGDLPTELSHLTDLQYLSLAINEFDTPLPAHVLRKLTNLQTLELRHNQFTGTIPVELADMTQLTSLSLRGNALTGTLPEELAHLTHLKKLYLEVNQLHGTIPGTWEALAPSLTSLGLWQNQLEETLEVPQSLQLLYPFLDPRQRWLRTRDTSTTRRGV